MGKTHKKESVASKVIRERKNLLEQIKLCQSLNTLELLEYSYRNDSKYTVPKPSRSKTSITLSVPQLREYAGLAMEINEAFAAQKNKLKLGLTQPEAESSDRLDDTDLVDAGNGVNVSELAEHIKEYMTYSLQELREMTILHIEAELVNVDKKRARMSTKGAAYEDATLATGRIHNALQLLTDKYIQDGDLQHYQDQTRALFDETTEDMKTINEHRGWAKNFFGNLAYFILGFGVGYAAVCAYRGKFFEFNTDTANVVGAVNEQIAALSMS
ncbi:MAG: hypothetical protein P4L79_01460 [Legionella sp.]|uniref:hypothetical protein n=1 Tax=Legionella sp. TaxID=459 RepID=UPI0028416CE0|nr:hypothetical protein [Legionella sp.]